MATTIGVRIWAERFPSRGYVTDRESIPALLKRHGLWAKKSLGQHFLLDESALDKIVAAAELSPDDTVLEIGPGPGPLTRRLGTHAGRVIAVELDGRMVELLHTEVAVGLPVEVVQADILAVDLGALMAARDVATYKVVANLPYYITSAVLRHILEAPLKPTRVVVLVQREVAERIVAKPPDMNLLGVSVQLFGAPRVVARVPAGAFYPPPRSTLPWCASTSTRSPPRASPIPRASSASCAPASARSASNSATPWRRASISPAPRLTPRS